MPYTVFADIHPISRQIFVSPYSSGHLISASSFFLYFAIIISPSQIVPQVIKLHEIIPTFIRSIKISVGIFVFKQELRRNVLSYISFLLSAPGVVTITFSGVIITAPFAIAAPLNIFSTIALKVLIKSHLQQHTLLFLLSDFTALNNILITVRTERLFSSSAAARIIPCDSTPQSLQGFKFVTTATFFPTISSGL